METRSHLLLVKIVGSPRSGSAGKTSLLVNKTIDIGPRTGRSKRREEIGREVRYHQPSTGLEEELDIAMVKVMLSRSAVSW
jgi:hypothetical protein